MDKGLNPINDLFDELRTVTPDHKVIFHGLLTSLEEMWLQRASLAYDHTKQFIQVLLLTSVINETQKLERSSLMDSAQDSFFTCKKKATE